MAPPPKQYDAQNVGFGSRYSQSKTLVGSPQTNEEAIVCQTPAFGNLFSETGVFLSGIVALTIGTSGTALTLRLRQTNASGTVVYSSGAMTVTAASLYCIDVQGYDTSPTLPGQVYVLTAQVTGGAAASTVSATNLYGVAV